MDVDPASLADDTATVNIGRYGDPKELDSGAEKLARRREVKKRS